MEELWRSLAEATCGFRERLGDHPVSPSVGPAEIRRHLQERYSFQRPVGAGELVRDVAAMLERWGVQVTHPRYFGLFNPTVRPVSVAADALVAFYNPQLALWAHAPAANEIERHVLRFFLGRLGFDPDGAAAHFTSGGQEANHTAVIAALTHRFPALAAGGLRALEGQPTLYGSAEVHHSFQKIAHATGLGRGALRTVPVGADLRMDPAALERAVEEDRRQGCAPFLAVATAGTTAAGVIDPLPAVAEVARRHGLWLHVDAAWGGAALLSRRLRGHLDGIEAADSATWDAHKWLSVPMAAGMLFCRHPAVLARAFGTEAGSYVPKGVRGTRDAYATSLQWSRRCIGLKVFMALAELGAGGYEELVDHQAAMGEALRERLLGAGWRVVNRTPLPLVCFTHPRIEGGALSPRAVAKRVVAGGRAWVSTVHLATGQEALRACITSYRTTPEDLDILVEELERAVAARQGRGLKRTRLGPQPPPRPGSPSPQHRRRT